MFIKEDIFMSECLEGVLRVLSAFEKCLYIYIYILLRPVII